MEEKCHKCNFRLTLKRSPVISSPGLQIEYVFIFMTKRYPHKEFGYCHLYCDILSPEFTSTSLIHTHTHHMRVFTRVSSVLFTSRDEDNFPQTAERSNGQKLASPQMFLVGKRVCESKAADVEDTLQKHS